MFYVGDTIQPYPTLPPIEVLGVTAHYLHLRNTATGWEYQDYLTPQKRSKYLRMPSTRNSVPVCEDIPGHPTWTEFYPYHLWDTYRYTHKMGAGRWYRGTKPVPVGEVWTDFYGV